MARIFRACLTVLFKRGTKTRNPCASKFISAFNSRLKKTREMTHLVLEIQKWLAQVWSLCGFICLSKILFPDWQGNRAPVIHYAPSENLEQVDVAFIYGEEHKIRMAAYGLMDGR